MLGMFARVAAATAITVGGLLAATGSATAAQPIAPVATPVAAPTVAADDPCGYWREGNWLIGYTYWYRHCASNHVVVHVDYYDGGSEETCFGPWEKRRLSWKTSGAHYAGRLC